MSSLEEKIINAYHRIQDIVRETPLDKSIYLSDPKTNTTVYLKCEHVQHTGSFKLRGATNKLLSMPKDQLKKGVITASTGNHGLAVSYASQQLGVKAIVYVPENVSETKAYGIESLGANLVKVGDNCLVAETTARKKAKETGMEYISPYNDIDIMIGQGTLGVEIANQMGNTPLDGIFISVGGGGLIGGIATFIKHKYPKCTVYGCQPIHSKVMFESIKAGVILQNVEEYPTISDATAGGIEVGCVTFPICQKVIDKFVLVSEEEIEHALKFVLEKERYLIEGSAAVAVASYFKVKDELHGKNVVILLCGRNISFTLLKKILK